MSLRDLTALALLFTLVTLSSVMVGARIARSSGPSEPAIGSSQPLPSATTVGAEATSSAAEPDATATPDATAAPEAPLALVDVTATPSSPRVGEPYEVSVTMHNIGADSLVFLLDVESYVEVAPDEWKKDPQKVKDQVRLDSGATRTYTFDMTSRESGPHIVHVGAFAAGWGEVLVFWEGALRMELEPAQ